MQTLLGIKTSQTQKFLQNGTRIPITYVKVPKNIIMQIKASDRDGYNAYQLGIGQRKNVSKSLLGHTKSAKIDKAPKYIKEAKTTEEFLGADKIHQGDTISALSVFEIGDLVNVSGVSKGKGFAGGVKRHHFKGGPRTHGQSDRERAPGSIGQTTTPGRVYKGKRMAGRMGNEKVTVTNLEVVNVLEEELWLKGLVPGAAKNLVSITKVGHSKNPHLLYKDQDESKTPDEKPQQEEKIQVDTASQENQNAQENTGASKEIAKQVKINAEEKIDANAEEKEKTTSGS